MVLVRQKDRNESADSLIRRFSNAVRQSGVLIQARKVRYFTRKKNRRQRREEAQRRAELTAERDRLIKLGEVDEYTYQRSHKSR